MILESKAITFSMTSQYATSQISALVGHKPVFNKIIKLTCFDELFCYQKSHSNNGSKTILIERNDWLNLQRALLSLNTADRQRMASVTQGQLSRTTGDEYVFWNAVSNSLT